MFRIRFSDGKNVKCEAPVTGAQLLQRLKSNALGIPVTACRVNSYLRPLSWLIDDDASVSWVDMSSYEGAAVYRSSLCFLFSIAARRVLKENIRVSHSISEGLFWEIDRGELNGDSRGISDSEVEAIRAEMDRLISADLPFTSEFVPADKARRFFEREGRLAKARLLAHTALFHPIEVYACDGERDTFCTPLLPSTGYLKMYRVLKLSPGVVLMYPTAGSPCALPRYRASRKLSSVFLDYASWMKKLHVSTMADIYDAVARDGGKELILMSEALHSQKISELTTEFLSVPDRRVITIAGPSGSGKTTTSHKLRIQLQVMEKRPVAISLDDYFVNREDCPRDEDGEYDFEALEALDLELLDEHIQALLAGREVELPRFDFYVGRRIRGKKLRLERDDVLILEGLHGLNDRLIDVLPREVRYGVFISPLTGISLDRHTRTSTTDHRLLRRMVRDYRTRGNTPESTLLRWPSVVNGGMKYIFPYQKNADVIFNSSLLYELPVIKPYAERLLRSVSEESEVYGEAMRLLNMLQYVPVMDADYVPSNSLIREFIGGSIIKI
ncbi:MAG: nucleoside kinase [Pyramidobacter sp.]|nr:nucleoside kinase [Pyramidobacter sp.]